jgi:hypothetical protein
MVSTSLLTAYFASTYWFVLVRSGVVVVFAESTTFTVSGLHTDRSSEYFPAPADVPVVIFEAHPKIKTEPKSMMISWRILFD